MSVAVIIGFRDRGADPRRQENLKYVVNWWGPLGAPVFVVDDGRTGGAQFNRSGAYNRGAARTDADILIYAEADMLIYYYPQIHEAIRLAREAPGLVVPFTQRRELTPEDTDLILQGAATVSGCEPASVQDANYGCINVLSRETLTAVGCWDEAMDGWAHDDCAMWLAFEKAVGPTRFVDGPAYHLYHDTLTGDADKSATERNYRRMQLYTQARTPEEIHHLTAGGKSLSRNWRGQLR